MSPLDALFAELWRDYQQHCPDAAVVHGLLEARGERVVNDHVAFRAFDRGPDLDALARPFLELGYAARGSYRFDDKHLVARHYERAGSPRVFISQLCVDELSKEAQSLIDGLVAQAPAALDLPLAGRPWAVDWAVRDRLLEESEYAAWLAVFGFRANHFTVSVGDLETFDSLEKLNACLLEAGVELNEAGGLIKGSPAVGLEQSSTRAGLVPVTLKGVTRSIPGCYYEFALRHGGFDGFVTTSANRLFESTDTR